MGKRKSGSSLPGLLLGMLIGVAGGVYIGTMLAGILRDGMTLPEYLLSLALLLVCMGLAWYAQIALHEAGHLVFGLLSGYRFSSYRIGSLMLVKEKDRLRLRRFSLAGTGGQCLMAPPDWSEAFPYVLYNLGGVLMNLLSALVFWLLSLLCPQAFWLRTALRIAAVLGAGMALLNGLPLRIGAADNDGRNILSIRRSPSGPRAFWLQMKINEQSALGVRLRDMPEAWFALPDEKEMAGCAIVAAVGVFRCNRLMDEQRFGEAAELMEKMLALPSLPGLYDGMLRCDLLYCELLGEGRPEKLGELYDRGQQRFMRAMRTQPAVLRTEYALALLRERDEQHAQERRAAFEKAAAVYPYPQDAQADRELVELAGQRGVVRS